ncbi:phosphatases II [Nemania sp. FL0916]|nr:phosphatases II [Nemania sp. FL0916]
MGSKMPSYPKTARPAAPYTRRAPSPPPLPMTPTHYTGPMKVVPRYDNVDPASLSNQDLAILTQNGLELVAHDSSAHWDYNDRRQAQAILDYLYLGPASVMRNRQWLQEQGITMVLAVRDARQAGRNMLAFSDVVQDLGIEPHYFDVPDSNELIRAFPSAIRIINDHMLRVYREQALTTPTNTEISSEAMVINSTIFRRGKVLVYCETGNDRSAGIVCAYLMAVFGMNANKASQFLNYKRFCLSMSENLRRVLSAYSDLLVAQRTVHQHELQVEPNSRPKKSKRGIKDTIDDDGDNDMTGMDQHHSSDRERFIGRDPTPFIDP